MTTDELKSLKPGDKVRLIRDLDTSKLIYSALVPRFLVLAKKGVRYSIHHVYTQSKTVITEVFKLRDIDPSFSEGEIGSMELLAEDIELFKPEEEYKKAGLCPSCGDRGEWRMLALFCRQGHGRFAG